MTFTDTPADRAFLRTVRHRADPVSTNDDIAMNCPNCRHENPNDARFCAQCGAPLTQPAPVAPATPTSTAPAAQPAGRRKASLIVLALVFCALLLAGGMYAFHAVANKAPAPAPVGTPTNARTDNSNAKPAVTQQGAPAAGNAIGTPVGIGAKGGQDSGKAPDNPTQAQPVEQHETSSGSASPNTTTPETADGGQAAGAMGGLLSALSASVGGVRRHDPVDFHTLEALLPSSLPGMPNATPDGNADDTMSIKTSSAHVDFSDTNASRIHLSITDATAISGLAGLANMANSEQSQQSDSYEKTEIIDGRSVHERWDAVARHGELSLSVVQRFAVDAVGDNVDMDALKNALAQIDLAKLESMKDANPVAK
ncbi:MAG: zinc-ribbon domain-containing protein [Vicinamibacterales bacterium]